MMVNPATGRLAKLFLKLPLVLARWVAAKSKLSLCVQKTFRMRWSDVSETHELEKAPAGKIAELREQWLRYQAEVDKIAREIDGLNTRLAAPDVAPSEKIVRKLSAE